MAGSLAFTPTFSFNFTAIFKLNFLKPELFIFIRFWLLIHHALARMVASQLNHQIILLLKLPQTKELEAPCSNPLILPFNAWFSSPESKFGFWVKVCFQVSLVRCHMYLFLNCRDFLPILPLHLLQFGFCYFVCLCINMCFQLPLYTGLYFLQLCFVTFTSTLLETQKYFKIKVLQMGRFLFSRYLILDSK